MSAPLAVLDIERIGWAALRAHAQHERREIGDCSHAAPDRRHLNRWLGRDACPQEAVRQYLGETGAKIDRRNERPFTRLLLSASPSYFRPGRVDQSGEYDPVRTQAWAKASVKWLRQEFGSDLVHVALHLDERTAHLHAVVVPTYRKKTKRRETLQVSHHQHPAFSGHGSFEACHDRYAAAVKALGVSRGERGVVGKKRMTKQEWLADAVRRFMRFRRAERKKLRVGRAALEERCKRAEPALIAAQRIAERGKDMAGVKELRAHREMLRSEPQVVRGRERER